MTKPWKVLLIWWLAHCLRNAGSSSSVQTEQSTQRTPRHPEGPHAHHMSRKGKACHNCSKHSMPKTLLWAVALVCFTGSDLIGPTFVKSTSIFSVSVHKNTCSCSNCITCTFKGSQEVPLWPWVCGLVYDELCERVLQRTPQPAGPHCGLTAHMCRAQNQWKRLHPYLLGMEENFEAEQ